MNICVDEQGLYRFSNGLFPLQSQAITVTKVDLLSTQTLATCSEIDLDKYTKVLIHAN